VSIYLNVGTATGTLPTLDMYIQQGFRALAAGDTTVGIDTLTTTYTIWDDVVHFAQVTAGPGVQILRWIGGPGTSAANTPFASFSAAKDAALAVSTVATGALGSVWRLKWVIGGTTPVYPTTWMLGQFLQVVG
jgi:hypothetical protein